MLISSFDLFLYSLPEKGVQTMNVIKKIVKGRTFAFYFEERKLGTAECVMCDVIKIRLLSPF